MGRRAPLEDAARMYFHVEREAVDGKSGMTKFVDRPYGKFCEHSWSSMTGSKQCAHICCLAGSNVAVCPQTVGKIGDAIKEQLYPQFKAGRTYLEDRLEGRSRYERERERKQSKMTSEHPDHSHQTIEECFENLVADEVDMLLAEAHHDQGNIPDNLWENRKLRHALKKLAAAKFFSYTTPNKKRVGVPLGLKVKEVVDKDVAETELDCEENRHNGWVRQLPIGALAREDVHHSQGPLI